MVYPAVHDLEEENISFLTLPTKYDEYINGTSYCVIKLEEWLDSINSYLNPYMEEITADNVNIITRDRMATYIPHREKFLEISHKPHCR